MSDQESAAVFLDIDGVLGPFGRANPEVVDAECVRRVHWLASIARIVLASSWPLSAAEETLGLSLETLGTKRRTYDGRPQAIWQWLCDHPEVTRWVSIDDDHIVRQIERTSANAPERALLQWPERFLRTDWTWLACGPKGGDGLTQKCYKRIRSTLLRPLEVKRLQAAIGRRERRLNALAKQARGACCPTCFHGHRYSRIVDAQERALAWLNVLTMQ